jgi:hypothetical protein
VSGVAFFLSVLLAQAAAPETLDAAPAKARASALLKEGSALFESGNAAGALEKFSAAYKEYPSPKLYFNIGKADLALDKRVEALAAFESFLSEASDADPAFFAEAKTTVTDLKTKLGEVQLDCPTAGATVLLDEKLLGTTPLHGPVWALPGTHRVTIRAARHANVTLTLEVVAGQQQTIEHDVGPAVIRWKPEPTAPAVTRLEDSDKTPLLTSSPTPAEPGWHRSWYFWTTASMTVLFTASAIVFGASANSQFDTFLNSCAKEPPGCSETAIDIVKSRAHTANVLWGLAGASAIATGAILYFDNREAHVSLAWRY